jgi:hypothetical protein
VDFPAFGLPKNPTSATSLSSIDSQRQFPVEYTTIGWKDGSE